MPVDALQQRRLGFYLKTDIEADDGELRKLPVSNRAEAERRCGELARAVAARLGLAGLRVTPHRTQGTFHLVHDGVLPDGGRLIVRSSLAGLFTRDTSFRLDAWAQARLPQAGLPGVPVLAVEDGQRDLPYGWMVMGEAPGAAMAALPEAVLDAPATMLALGRALRQAHRLPLAGGGYGPLSVEEGEGVRGAHGGWADYALCRLERHLRDGVAAGLVSLDEARRLERAAPGLALDGIEACVLHGDPGNHNFFVRDGRISALIDWEDALAGDPLHEAAFWASFHPRRRWAAFFEGYGLAPGPEAWGRFAFYYCRITLAKVLHRRRFGYADRPGRPNARQRMEEAMALLDKAGAGAASWLRAG